MSGICSAHQEFVWGCPLCEAGRMVRPKVKDFQSEETHQVDYYEYFKAMSRYAEDLEARLKAEQKSVNELSLHCQDLELRIKRAEDLPERPWIHFKAEVSSEGIKIEDVDNDLGFGDKDFTVTVTRDCGPPVLYINKTFRCPVCEHEGEYQTNLEGPPERKMYCPMCLEGFLEQCAIMELVERRP